MSVQMGEYEKAVSCRCNEMLIRIGHALHSPTHHITIA